MKVFLRSWLLLSLVLAGSLSLWESISMTGIQTYWSRQCYFHSGSYICEYGSTTFAFIMAGLMVGVVLMLVNRQVKILNTLQIWLVAALMVGLCLIAQHYIIQTFTNVEPGDLPTTGWMVDFLNGRFEVMAAVLASLTGLTLAKWTSGSRKS